MKLAMEEAKTAFAEEEVPVGAVLLFKDGGILKAHNTSEAEGPLSHAELTLISKGLEIKGRDALKTATIYVTLEPCLMCLGAMIHARIAGLVFGAEEPRFGGLRLLEQAWKDGRYPYRFPCHGGLMSEEAALLMKNFFAKLR